MHRFVVTFIYERKFLFCFFQGASSSRAAELLQASGGLGFDALNLIPGLVDETSDVNALMDEIGLNVDPGLRIIFKKLSKRDAQTREKVSHIKYKFLYCTAFLGNQRTVRGIESFCYGYWKNQEFISLLCFSLS